MKRESHRFDGILTLRLTRRRNSVGLPPCAAAVLLRLWIILPAIAAVSPAQAEMPDRQPVADITQAAEAFLERRIARTNRSVTPKAAKLDPRLQLARCDTALEGFLRPGTAIGSRAIVGVRCGGSAPWKVYVPVDLIEMRRVLVARRALPRGHILTEDDLVAEERDVSRITGGYLADMEAASGQRLKRQLVSGHVISPSMLETEVVIRRGQSVTLVVRNDALNISMEGKALADGAVNERIRVENTVSHRVIEGFVRSAEYVEVIVR